MTDAEVAIQRMIDRHEFLRFEHRYGRVRAVCYCGTKTRLYLSESTAQTEHKRHQEIELRPTSDKRAKGGMAR
jgi:hypothetical protein